MYHKCQSQNIAQLLGASLIVLRGVASKIVKFQTHFFERTEKRKNASRSTWSTKAHLILQTEWVLSVPNEPTFPIVSWCFCWNFFIVFACLKGRKGPPAWIKSRLPKHGGFEDWTSCVFESLGFFHCDIVTLRVFCWRLGVILRVFASSWKRTARFSIACEWRDRASGFLFDVVLSEKML